MGSSLTQEQYVQCPYCGEMISFVVDLSVGDQAYVEDCEVCCRPIEVSYATDGNDLLGFDARRLDG